MGLGNERRRRGGQFCALLVLAVGDLFWEARSALDTTANMLLVLIREEKDLPQYTNEMGSSCAQESAVTTHLVWQNVCQRQLYIFRRRERVRALQGRLGQYEPSYI